MQKYGCVYNARQKFCQRVPDPSSMAPECLLNDKDRCVENPNPILPPNPVAPSRPSAPILQPVAQPSNPSVSSRYVPKPAVRQQPAGINGSISGPITAYSGTYKGKNYYFFGDIHRSMTGECDKPCNDFDIKTLQPTGDNNCYDISRLLARIFNNAAARQEVVDFYLEIPLSVANKPENQPNQDFVVQTMYRAGYLYKLFYIFYNCFHRHDCPYDAARFHYVDIRQTYKSARLDEMMDEVMLKVAQMLGKIPKDMATTWQTIPMTFEYYLVLIAMDKCVGRIVDLYESKPPKKPDPYVTAINNVIEALYTPKRTGRGTTEPKNLTLFNIYLTSDDYIKDVTALFPEVFQDITDAAVKTELTNILLYNNINVVERNGKVITRIRAQLLALENEGQQEFARQIRDFIIAKYRAADHLSIYKIWSRVWKQYQEIFHSTVKYKQFGDLNVQLENLIKAILELKDTEAVAIPSNSLLMDAYTLGRMFRKFSSNEFHQDSSRAIVYAGDAHIRTYVDFFEQVLNVPFIKYAPNGDLGVLTAAKVENIIRCIPVNLNDFL